MVDAHAKDSIEVKDYALFVHSHKSPRPARRRRELVLTPLVQPAIILHDLWAFFVRTRCFSMVLHNKKLSLSIDFDSLADVERHRRCSDHI